MRLLAIMLLFCSSAFAACTDTFYGYGASASGGTTVTHVTTLSDTGAGSLRTALSASGRHIVFDVGGTINVGSEMVVPANTCIDGFSAPSAILLNCSGATTSGGACLAVNHSNVIVQGIRVRNSAIDSIHVCSSGACTGADAHVSNIVLDQVEIEVAGDGLGDVTGGSQNVTISNSILSNGNSGAGLQLIKYGVQNHVTLYHNLYTNSTGTDSRVPLMWAGGDSACSGHTDNGVTLQMVGNVVSNFLYGVTMVSDGCTMNYGNLVNNFLDGQDVDHARNSWDIDTCTGNESWFLQGNAVVLTPAGIPSAYNAICSGGTVTVTNSNTLATAGYQAASAFTAPTIPTSCVYDKPARITEWQNVIANAGVKAHFADDATTSAIRAAVATPSTTILNQTWNAQTGSCSATLVSITLTPASVSIPKGSTSPLTVACLWSDSTTVCPTLSWGSTASSIASVNSSGVVTGVSIGSANITASANSITSNAVPISVTAPNAAQPPSIFALLLR